jgi:hypothetical protein
MSQLPTATQEKDLVPPEERFWKRYSPHHEFPLSSVGSVVLHILSIGALVVIAYILTRTRGSERLEPASIDVVAVSGPLKNAGGGGKPGGQEDASGGTSTKRGKEIVKESDPLPPSPGNVQVEKGVTLNMVELPPLNVKVTEGGERIVVGLNQEVMGDLNTIIEQTRRKNAEDMARTAKGKDGPGKGEGKGTGDGPGEGGGKGPGVPGGGTATIRQIRNDRWGVYWIYRSTPGDLLKLYSDMQVFIGVPTKLGSDGHIEECLVIRDIKKNAIAKREDVYKLNRMFWMTSEPGPVLELARALGLRRPPPFFLIFHPPEFEENLLRLEKQAFSGDESRIAKTFFRIINRGGVTDVELDPDHPIVLKR